MEERAVGRARGPLEHIGEQAVGRRPQRRVAEPRAQPRTHYEHVSDAASQGDVAALREYLAAGGDPNEVDERGAPLIVLACGPNGSLDAARVLLEAKAAVDKPDQWGVTALAQATSQADATIVALLLQNGADPNARDRGGYTPLMRLGFDGCPGQGKTGQCLEVARLLVARGADPGHVAPNGETPLAIARAHVKDPATEGCVVRFLDQSLAAGGETDSATTP